MARLTVAQVAELCDVTPQAVRMWIRRGRVRRRGGYLDSAEVLRWWDHHRDATKDPRSRPVDQPADVTEQVS